MIDKFDGIYAFLSNFYDAPVEYLGITYRNSESAYQAQKCPARIHEFTDIPAAMAKKMGRKIEIRDDWEEVKDNIMFAIVYAKFSQNPDLKQKLIDTGKAPIIEGNTWGDTYWGQVDGKGKNMLGKILMIIRHEFQNET